jgi:hypothetical protein
MHQSSTTAPLRSSCHRPSLRKAGNSNPSPESWVRFAMHRQHIRTRHACAIRRGQHDVEISINPFVEGGPWGPVPLVCRMLRVCASLSGAVWPTGDTAWGLSSRVLARGRSGSVRRGSWCVGVVWVLFVAARSTLRTVRQSLVGCAVPVTAVSRSI